MANVIITLLVETTGLLNDSSPLLKDYCTLAQLGGHLVDDSNNNLANDISEVNSGDTITWNAISNSIALPSGVTGVVVNVLNITASTVFGNGQAMATQLPVGATGGTAAQGAISSGSEGDMATYTISFNIVTMTEGGITTSQTYHIDPKIRVHTH